MRRDIIFSSQGAARTWSAAGATLALLLAASPASAADPEALRQPSPDALARFVERNPVLLAQAYSCSPRRTCGEIGSCDEAHWYLGNCPWGGRLDRDNDGIPCESMC
jgi:hypothetical protein